MIPLPPLSFSSGPAISGATGGEAVTPFSQPFMFDNSGWNVSIKSSGNQSATGSSGAQAKPSTLSAMTGMNLPKVALVGLGLWLLLK